MEGLIQDIARRRAWSLPGRSKLRMVWRSIVRCFQLMVKSCDSEGLEEGGPSRVTLSSFRRRCDDIRMADRNGPSPADVEKGGAALLALSR